MNNLKDIHNGINPLLKTIVLFYQDFNEQFEGHTQRAETSTEIEFGCFIRISMNNLKDIHNSFNTAEQGTCVVLSGFQ